ncbi:flavin reductase [Nocardia sp. R6R-6]|uniref:flavin reductase n=1 Tax=Nocardia sp. R6R-6 TaxID=3459303 RepID=UPI00403E2D4F
MQHSGEQLSAGVLREAFGCYPSGVVSICAMMDGADGPEAVGMVASSFVTVSFEPPLVAFCVQWSSTTWPRLAGAPRLGVSILAEAQGALAQQMASKHGDRFKGLDLHVRDTAVFVEGAAVWMLCSVESTFDAGDHGIVLLRIEALTTSATASSLVFHRSKFRALAP